VRSNSAENFPRVDKTVDKTQREKRDNSGPENSALVDRLSVSIALGPPTARRYPLYPLPARFCGCVSVADESPASPAAPDLIDEACTLYDSPHIVIESLHHGHRFQLSALRSASFRSR